MNGIETEDPEMIKDFWFNLDDPFEEDTHSHDHPLYDTTDLSIDPTSQQSRGAVTSTMASLEMEESNSLNLLQQPQAMGFYVSTAPPGPLPQWFWSSCPHRKNHLPVCFKVLKHVLCVYHLVFTIHLRSHYHTICYQPLLTSPSAINHY